MVSSKIRLKYKDRDILFQKEYNQLKIKVASNWLEIVTLVAIIFFISFKTCLSCNVENIIISILISGSLTFIIAFLVSHIRNYQLKITRYDKEDVYKKISHDLIEKSKNLK
jgi:hypothetical protein